MSSYVSAIWSNEAVVKVLLSCETSNWSAVSEGVGRRSANLVAARLVRNFDPPARLPNQWDDIALSASFAAFEANNVSFHRHRPLTTLLLLHNILTSCLTVMPA